MIINEIYDWTKFLRWKEFSSFIIFLKGSTVQVWSYLKSNPQCSGNKEINRKIYSPIFLSTYFFTATWGKWVSFKLKIIPEYTTLTWFATFIMTAKVKIQIKRKIRVLVKITRSKSFVELNPGGWNGWYGSSTSWREKNGLKKKSVNRRRNAIRSKYLPLDGRYAWQKALRRVSSI